MKETRNYEVWIYDDSMAVLGYPSSKGVLKRGLTKAEANSIARHYNRITLRLGVDISYTAREEGGSDDIF